MARAARETPTTPENGAPLPHMGPPPRAEVCGLRRMACGLVLDDKSGRPVRGPRIGTDQGFCPAPRLRHRMPTLNNERARSGL